MQVSGYLREGIGRELGERNSKDYEETLGVMDLCVFVLFCSFGYIDWLTGS